MANGCKCQKGWPIGAVRAYQRQELKTEQALAWRLMGDRLELLTAKLLEAGLYESDM